VTSPGKDGWRWTTISRASGSVAGVGLLLGTLLFLLDATHALGADPQYRSTPAGPLQDEANFWVALFAHKHHILWDIVARDTLFPVAFVALIVLSLGIRRTVGNEWPEVQLMTAFFMVGGVISALADLIYLAGSDYWRVTGWPSHPPERMVAVGRSADSLSALTRWPEAAGFVILGAALLCLGRLCNTQRELPSRLGPLVNLEALLLIGIAVAGVMESDTAYNILSLLTGALIGPAVALWLGWHLGREDRAS
jgi:hypothetical protein